MRNKNKKNNFALRLKELIGNSSVNSIAKSCEIPESSIRQYLNGTLPRVDIAVKFATFFEVSLDYLLNDEKPLSLTRNEQTASDYTLIPRFELSASAGGGAVIDHEQQSGEMAFRTDWLKSKNISPDHASVITVEGDSMKPTLEAGDSLLVNTSPTIQGHIQEGIYVISLDDQLMVKRLQRTDRQTINILSDNVSYPPITVTDPEAKKFRLIGRVIWYGRNI